MTIPFDPVPRNPTSFATKIDGVEVAVKVDEPGKLEKTVPPPIWQTVLIRAVIVLMVSLFAVMLFLGLRRFNPMMIMSMFAMFGMIGMMGGGHLFGGKNSQGELDLKRDEYVTGLREQRRNAHAVNRHIHGTQTAIYPHPGTLEARCGVATQMWTTPPVDGAPAVGSDGRVYAESARTSPWGTARIGVGYRRTEPYIAPAANDAPEVYEPVQAAAYMRFIRTHNVITNCPIGIDVFARPFIVCAGDQGRLLETARAMICSLASNHAPKHLQLGIITTDVAEWDWMKWLPHCTDPSRRDKAGPARLHWPSIDAYAQDQRHPIAAGGPHTATRDATSPYRVIFVDLPGQDPDIPAGIGPAGLADHTFVYIRHG